MYNKDYPHSWVRNSHGLNKLVTILSNDEQETSEMQFEEFALKLNAGDFACRSKAGAKPKNEILPAHPEELYLLGKEKWTDVEPGKYSISDYEVSKKLIRLLRHGSLPRDDDGAIEFWRIRDNLLTYLLNCHHWFDDKWKSSMEGGGGNKKRFQYCTDSSGTILYLRALQGHSGRSLIDPSFQDNAIIPDGFFKYIYHVGCAINFLSNINSGLIPGGHRMPDFEVLGAKIASELNRIIHNSHFKSRVSLEDQKALKEVNFVRGRQIAYLIYKYFRATGANDSVENNADLFTIALRNDDIQELDSEWDGILLSMTKIPSDDILAGLYKLRVRESEKLKTVLELYNLEIHQKKAGPDDHRLKTLVKEVSSRIYEL